MSDGYNEKWSDNIGRPDPPMPDWLQSRLYDQIQDVSQRLARLEGSSSVKDKLLLAAVGAGGSIIGGIITAIIAAVASG